MTTYLVAFVFATMVAAVLTLVVRNRAHRFGWFDQAKTSRKVHSRPIPRLGGLAIVGGFLAPLAALLVVDSGVGRTYAQHPDLIVGLFGGGLVIVALGLWDDFRGIGAKEKFLVQTLVACGLYAIGFRVESIASPFGAPIPLGDFALPFTLLWIVGVVNAFNLIDGLDGLAGGVAFFAVSTNLVLALVRGDVLMALMMVSLAGAILGFLLFNFNPASIFMGDTGSMFLGFVLAAVSIKTSTKSSTTVAMIVPVIALGLPIMDTLLAMIRRTILGRPMFAADKEHIHHRLMSRLGVSHRRAVLTLYALCCLFGLTALTLAFANGRESALLLTALAGVVFVVMRKLGYLSWERAAAASETRRKNQQVWYAVREINLRIQAATSLHEVWTAVRPMSKILDAAQFELRLEQDLEDAKDITCFEIRRSAGTALPVEGRFETAVGGRCFGHLTAVWRDGRADIDPDDEIALTSLAGTIAEALHRLSDSTELPQLDEAVGQ